MATPARLGHVRWVGGATGGGKTTIAGLLSARFGLSVYSTDATISLHGTDGGPDAPLLTRFREMDMDERWLRREPEVMLETFPWFAGERFDRIIADLLALPLAPMTVAEGFRLLPRLVVPVLEEAWQALWLIPTPEFRRAAFEQRPPEQKFWRHTSDPRLALERLLARDAMFAAVVSRDAERLDCKVISVDGSRSAPEIADEAAHWLRLTRSG